MSSDQTWKEKYFQELETAEQQEEQWKAERNTLERMLVRTSLASEGQTPELDSLLERVRSDLRKKGRCEELARAAGADRPPSRPSRRHAYPQT